MSTNGTSTEHFYPHGTFTKRNVHPDTSSFGQFDTHSQRPPPLQAGQYVTFNIMSTLIYLSWDMLSISDKASPKLCHFIIAMKEGSRELPISQSSGPLTPPSLVSWFLSCCLSWAVIIFQLTQIYMWNWIKKIRTKQLEGFQNIIAFIGCAKF
jgi:hypothetical protein